MIIYLVNFGYESGPTVNFGHDIQRKKMVTIAIDTSSFVSRVLVVPTVAVLRRPELLEWRDGLFPFVVVAMTIPGGMEKILEPEMCLLYASKARVFPDTFASPHDAVARMSEIERWFEME